MNSELVKAVDAVEKINKNKNYKFSIKNDKEKSGIGFDNLLKEEMDKLKSPEENVEEARKYYLLLKEVYERERRKGINRFR